MRFSTEQLLQTMGNQMCSFPRESRWFFGHRPDSMWSRDLAKHFSASVKCFDISNCVKTLSSSAVLVNLCNNTKCLQVLRVVTAYLDPHLWPRHWLPSVGAHSLVGLHPPSGAATSQTSSSRLSAKQSLLLLLK